MKYLLDVNALIAWRHQRSPHHGTFHAWAARVKPRQMATCALSELGFLRVSMQVFSYSREQAMDALAEMKAQAGGFVGDAPTPRLADWATSAALTTDAYLVQVATENGLRLATFDRGIPAAVLIGER